MLLLIVKVVFSYDMARAVRSLSTSAAEDENPWCDNAQAAS